MNIPESLPEKLKQEIGGLTSAITDMLCKFKQMEQPLVETHQEVPKATNQLDKISKQTEAVTNRMLDLVEQITRRDEEIVDCLKQLTQLAKDGKSGELYPLTVKLTDKVNMNQNATYKIMETLQFQDITAQQMNYAASMLEDIEQKMLSILEMFGSKADKQAADSPAGRTFDPHAELIDQKAAQADIDTLFTHAK